MDELAAFVGHALDVVAPVQVAAWTTGVDDRSVQTALDAAVVRSSPPWSHEADPTPRKPTRA